jgi:hypothetical protein
MGYFDGDDVIDKSIREQTRKLDAISSNEKDDTPPLVLSAQLNGISTNVIRESDFRPLYKELLRLRTFEKEATVQIGDVTVELEDCERRLTELQTHCMKRVLHDRKIKGLVQEMLDDEPPG